MSPKAKKRIPRRELPGYSLADALVLTSATLSNVQHWTKVDIIAADFVNAEGKGNHRRFSTFNLVELQLCATLNRLRLPAEQIRGAANIFRAFHIGAVAFHEENTSVPFKSSTVRVVTPGCDGSIMPGRLGLVDNAKSRFSAAQFFQKSRWLNNQEETPEKIAGLWHLLRTSGTIQGRKGFPGGAFIGLFIGESAAVVTADPQQILSVLDGSAIAIDLVDVVWRVGERRAGLGCSDLAGW